MRSLTNAQICLDVIRQYHLGNKVEEIGAFISKRVGEGLNSLNQCFDVIVFSGKYREQ